MKQLAVFVLPLLCFAAGASPEIDSVIGMARAAPGEFAADAMIRVASLASLEKTRKIKLLEEAFGRASEAQEPYRRRAGITKVSSAGFFNRAYDQDLDGMTLRLRAVEAMLPLDQEKARDLFSRIPPIQLPALNCSDFLVYDVSRYYEVLGRIAAETFTPKQVEKGEPVRLLLRYAGSVASPAQVAPMAQAISHSLMKDGDFQAVASAYAGALGRISGDDRSFTHAQSAGPAILDLMNEMKRRKISPLPLLESYRLYLVTHLSGVRCADDDQMQNGPTAMVLPGATPSVPMGAADYFNQTLRVPPLQLIGEGEGAPSKTEGTAEGLRSCEDTDCQAIANQYRSLVFQPNGLPYQMADRQSAEWQARFLDFLNAMEAWKENSTVPAAQYYRNKCAEYTQLIGLAPTPENRDTVAQALLNFAQRSKFQAASRIQWFLPVNAMLGRGAIDPNGFGKITAGLLHSADAVIALYAALDAVAPRGPERVMPLL